MDEQLYRRIEQYVVTQHFREDTSPGGDGALAWQRNRSQEVGRFNTREEALAFCDLQGWTVSTSASSKWHYVDPWKEFRVTVAMVTRYEEV